MLLPFKTFQRVIGKTKVSTVGGDDHEKGLSLHTQSPLVDDLGSVGRQQLLQQPGPT